MSWGFQLKRNPGIVNYNVFQNNKFELIAHKFHSFIFHTVNPYKVPNNLKDIELVILLIIYT